MKKTVIALAVLALMGGVVYWLQRAPREGERVGEKPRPVPKIDRRQISQLEVTARDYTVTFVRRETGWEIASPVRYAAENYAVKVMLDEMEKLEFADMVTRDPKKHAELEVATKKFGVHVKASGAKGTVVDFYFGKIIDKHTMFRLVDKPEVWQLVGTVRLAFEKDLRNWRDRWITHFERDQARKIEITTTVGTVVLERKGKKAPWRVTSSPRQVGRLDRDTVKNLVSLLYKFATFDFADKKTPAEAGLTSPRGRLRIHLADGKQMEILVGKRVGEDVFVQRAGKAQVFSIKAYWARNLLLRPIDLREKTMLRLRPESVVELVTTQITSVGRLTTRLRRKGGKWLVDGKKLKYPAHVKKALDTLSKLKAEGYARHTPAELGLDKPRWHFTVKLRDGKQHELLVGRTPKDKRHGVRLSGREEIFLLGRYTLDKFLLDDKKLKKKPEPEGRPGFRLPATALPKAPNVPQE